jgi:hypothetical protein
MNTQCLTRKNKIIIFHPEFGDLFFCVLNLYKNPNLIRTTIFGSSDQAILVELVSLY